MVCTIQYFFSGRTSKRNIIRIKSGPTPYTKRHLDDPLSAFRLLFDDSMLKSIQKYTNIHGQLTDPEFKVSVQDIEKFIGIQYARGVLIHQ